MDTYEAIRTRRTLRDFSDIPIPSETLRRILNAGLQAPTNDHLRRWEFVVVDDRLARARLLRVTDMTDPAECDQMLDGFGMTDSIQRAMYHAAMPRQFSMLYRAGSLILPFFRQREPLLHPSSLSSLNEFASIWCCIENMLIAAAAEGIFGVTRIPMPEETEHIQKCLAHPPEYVMPCYIALGYPTKDAMFPLQKPISLDSRLHHNRW